MSAWLAARGNINFQRRIMPTHRTSELIKDEILNACRILFFENGYDNTTYKDIEQATGILSGSIYYHFKKKEEIRNILFQETAAKIVEEVSRYADCSNPYQAFMLNNFFTWYKIFHNIKYRRFFLESPIGNASLDYYIDNFYGFKKILSPEVAEKIHFSRMDLALCYGVDSGLGSYIIENYDEYTKTHDYIYTSERELTLYATILKINPEIYRSELNKIKEILKTVDWNSLDYGI